MNPYMTRVLTGGLNTKTPQTRMDPSESPDLENVLLNRFSVDKRTGFAPLMKQQPNLNSIRNQGWHGVSRASALEAAPNTDYLIVPGHMLAGHRKKYENLGAVSGEMILEVGDLTEEHGGNSEPTGPTRWGPAPFTLLVRPILSKGPVHRTDDQGTAVPSNGAIAWDNTNPWGDGATEGLPFCLYLWNNSGTWEFRLSFHTKSTNWALRTVVSGAEVEVGAEYHVVFSINDSTKTASLRVGRRRPGEATAYSHGTTTFGGDTWTTGNRCPIQVFDCPQDFIEATGTGDPDVRPGLDLSGDTDGGYYFACKRFEGRIEDLVIYDSDKLDGNTGALDRDGKVDISSLTGVINAWTMDRPGRQYVEEMTRRGNHLYFVPAGPIFDPISGAPRGKGTWWFNGQTSYGMVDLDSNPSWREYTSNGSQVGAFMREVVQNNHQHGLQVAFWVDSIEPTMEQVIMEIQGVLRLAIGIDGKLRGYCRDDVSQATFRLGGSEWQDVFVTSNFVLEPGRRYVAELMRLEGGGSLTLSINNGADITQTTGLNPSDDSADAADVGGVTFGMGGVENMIADPARAAQPNQLNVDSRSGFIGRIEQARIVCSDVRQAPIHKDASLDDLQFRQPQLWRSPSVSRDTIEPDDDHDVVQNREIGLAAEISKDTQGDRRIRYLVEDTSNPNLYTLFGAVAEVEEGGHADLEHAKVRTWFCLAEWNFDLDDGLLNYAGSYLRGIEYRYNGSNAVEANAYRSVHVQQSEVADRLRCLGAVQKRCIESDIMSEDYNAAGATGPGLRVTSHRLKPYHFRSPRELSVRWAEGMLTPLTGTNRISLLADWQHQESGERFLMTAAGRQLYWAKPIWRQSSPFPSEITGKAAWFGGNVGDRIVALSSQAQQETTGDGSRTTLVFETWLFPFSLDGGRLVVMKGDPFTQEVNYAIHLFDGSVGILGTADGNTKAWQFFEGGYSGNNLVRSSSMKVMTWNHLHVTLKDSGPEVRVNGELVPLADGSSAPSVAVSDAFTDGDADAGPFPMYLGGLPKGRTRIVYNATPGAIPANYAPFHGLMTEVRVRNAEDLVNWPAGESGTLPTGRYEDDANTYYLFHLNEGNGWGFENATANASLDGARADITELVLVEEGLEEESTDHRYDWVVFRDRLYLTNGESFPRAIRFTRFTDPDGAFRSWKLGMDQPFVHAVALTQVQSTSDDPLTTGLYLASMAFLNEDGTASDAVPLGELDLTGGATGEGIHVSNLPRSYDPQVVARRLYLSAQGGGAPIFAGDLPDNESGDVDLFPPTTGEGVPVGSRQPAPRARHIAIGQFSVVLADLPDLPAGRNAFWVSQAQEPYWFDSLNLVVVDGQDGKPIIGIRGLYGRTYITKRDSVWQFVLSGISIQDEFNLGLREVNEAIGFGGGMAAYDNIIFGAGQKGVHRFNGQNVEYASEALENDWNTLIDRSDAGLIHMFGSYYWPDSQYWLSVRSRGQTYNELAYVLHTAVGDRQSWVRMRLPRHSYLASRLRSEDQEPELLIGTIHGSILRLTRPEEDVGADAVDNGRDDKGNLLLQGTIQSSTTTSLVVAGGGFANLDTVANGLRGAVIQFLDAGMNVTATRTIESNTNTQITWREPLSPAPTGAFELGGYLGYWTSGWIAPQKYGHLLRVNWLDIDILPSPGNLLVENQVAIQSELVAKAWDPAQNLDSRTINMATGWTEEPMPLPGQNRGRYFRVRFSTHRINTPFSVVGWGFRWTEEGIRGPRSV